MKPIELRKFLETFDAAMSVQIFVETELIQTLDELDVLDVNVFYERYKRWPPRVKMPEAKFIEFLETTCKLDVVPWDERENLPALIVGVQLKGRAGPRVRPKKKYDRKPAIPLASFERAARLPSFAAAASHLGMSSRCLQRIFRNRPEVAALFNQKPESDGAANSGS